MENVYELYIIILAIAMIIIIITIVVHIYNKEKLLNKKERVLLKWEVQLTRQRELLNARQANLNILAESIKQATVEDDNANNCIDCKDSNCIYYGKEDRACEHFVKKD